MPIIRILTITSNHPKHFPHMEINLDSEIQVAIENASKYFYAMTEKEVSAFVCRHLKCEPAISMDEAKAVLQQATDAGLEFIILEHTFDCTREIAVRKIGEEEFFDRATLPSFRDMMSQRP